MADLQISAFSHLSLNSQPSASPARLEITNQTDIYQIDKFVKESLDSGLEILDEDDFERIKLLGAGGTMSAYEAKWKSRSKTVALKYINLSPPMGASSGPAHDSELQNVLRSAALELRVLRHEHCRRHPNIVDILAVSWQQFAMPTGSCNIYPILVMELACPSHPTLDQLVYMKVSLNLRLSLLRDVLEGVSVLHKLLVVHGDIKPENILLFEGGVGRLTAKVSDFGFSQSDSHPRWTGQEAGGTEYWNAPECLHTATESLRTFSKLNHRDIYSFGLLTCFVLLEELPFDEQGWGAKELSAEKLGGQIGKAMISRWRSTKSGQAKQTYGILDFNGIETDELNLSDLVWEVQMRKVWCKVEKVPLLLLRKVPDMLHTEPLQRATIDCIRDALKSSSSLLSHGKRTIYELKGESRITKSSGFQMPSVARTVLGTKNMIQFRPYNPSIPERLRIALFKHNFAATKDRDRMKRIEAMIGVGNAMLTSLLARNDIAEAMTWFSRAAKEGSQEGQEMVFRLERHMKRSVVELIPGVGQKDRATWMVECLLRNFLDDAVGGPASTGLDVDNLQRRLKHILLGFDTEMIENGLQRAIDNDIVRMRTMKKGYHREDENWADFPGLLVAIQSDDVQALNDALSSYESAISVETKQLLVFTACEERSENVLRALVQVHHFDLDASFGNALHDALRRDDSGIASLLTDLGAPWNFVLAGESLHYIICGCSNSTVRHLMHLVSALPLAFPECPSYVDPVVRQRETMDGIRFGMAVHPQDDNDTVDNLHPPLFDAILHNRVYSVRVILALGANPNIRYMGMTALHLAASLLLPWMVAILLAYGADPNARDFRRAHQTPLHQVSMAYFVVRPSGVNKYGEYRDIFGNLFIPAPEYLNEGDSHRRLIIHLLLAYRADLQTLDDHDSTPLMRALESRHAYAPMVARCLIDLGADVSKTGVRGLSAVHAATVGQNLQILRHLLYDTDAALLNQATKEGMTPLHFAAATGRLGSLAILLEAGADISVRNKNGFTAFDIAMMSEQKQAFDLFLHHINQLPQRARDVVVYLHGNMWTAAHSALKCQDRLIGTYFLMKAMPLVREIEKRGVLGYTPLHFAVWRKNGPALEFLIKKGADVNIRAFKGMTPLHVAYGVGDRTLIEFLISQKADTTIKNELDLTPPEFGIQAGQNPEILQHIFEEGMSLLTDAAASEKISQRLNANVKQEKERLAEESQYAFEDRFTLGSSERVTMVETAHSEILEVSIRKYGENHFESLWRMNNLGCVYERYGRKRKAEQMYRRGWRISLQVLGREHRLSQDFANKIARVLADSGQTDDKEIREWISEFGRETLEPPLMPFLCTAAERKPTVLPSAVVPALSPSKPDKTQPTVLPSTALSGPSLSNSDEKAAETLPTHHSWQPQDDLPALEERETALNQEHMQLTDAFRELGTLYIKQGKLEKAENVLQRALETYEKVLGPVDLKTLRVAIDLGATYQSQDKLDQSESMYRRALEGFQKAWETQMENSMKTLRPVEYIHDEAKIYKAEATRTTAKFGESKKAMDEIGMLILKAASSLGSVYLSQEKLEDAENMYLRALESYNKDSDVDQTSVIITVKGLRSILVKRGFNQTPQPEGIIDNRFKVLIALIKLAFDWKGSPIFGTLGRVLMWVSDERGAKAALSHEIVVRLDGNSVYDSVQCDGCHAPLTYAMKRFVCKRCEDIDLCGDCLKKHEKGVQQLLTCVDHSFLEVTDELSAWSGERSYDETAMRNAWLDRLFMTYVEAAWRQTLV